MYRDTRTRYTSGNETWEHAHPSNFVALIDIDTINVDRFVFSWQYFVHSITRSRAEISFSREYYVDTNNLTTRKKTREKRTFLYLLLCFTVYCIYILYTVVASMLRRNSFPCLVSMRVIAFSP